jgi:hypothetical protein
MLVPRLSLLQSGLPVGEVQAPAGLHTSCVVWLHVTGLELEYLAR